MPSDQSRIIEQPSLRYSPLGKAFEKQTKTIEEQGKKQIDAITNQSQELEILTNKDNLKSDYKETLDKVVKEKLGKIEELTNEIDYNDLINYFKNNTASKDFTDFENGVKLLNKIKFGQTRLENAKEVPDIFKINLSKISKRRFKSEKQKSALTNIKTL